MRSPQQPALAAGISIADIFSVFIGVVPFVGFRLSFHVASALAMLWCSVSGYLAGSIMTLQVPPLRERLFVVQKVACHS